MVRKMLIHRSCSHLWSERPANQTAAWSPACSRVTIQLMSVAVAIRNITMPLERRLRAITCAKPFHVSSR